MSALNNFVRQTMNQQLIESLAWSLIHFLWQGAAIVAVVGLILWLLRSARPTTRYAVCLIGLIAMTACPIVMLSCFDPVPGAFRVAGETQNPIGQTANPELLVSDDASNSISIHELAKGSVTPNLPSEVVGAMNQPMNHQQNSQNFEFPNADAESDAESDAVSQADLSPAADGSLSARSPVLISTNASRWIVGIWLVGVGLFGLRLLLSWIGVWRLRTQVAPVSDAINAKTKQLAKALRVAHPLIRTSQRVTQAIAVGFFKPMILLPASWLTELTPEMLEAIIAHELAHIRRGDLWVNLFQRVVEAFLFYHPAVWWLSRRIRIERELCCDAMVVEATQDRLLYAETLEHVGRLSLARSANRRPGESALAVQSVGSQKILLTRIRSILQATDRRHISPSWPAVAAILAVGCLLVLSMVGFTSGSSTPSDSDSESLVLNVEDDFENSPQESEERLEGQNRSPDQTSNDDLGEAAVGAAKLQTVAQGEQEPRLSLIHI